MKTKLLSFAGLLLCWWSITSCDKTIQNEKVTLKDYGAEPTVLDIDAYTMANSNFRTSLWTGTLLQVTLMEIKVGGEVGLEQHTDMLRNRMALFSIMRGK